MKDLHSNVAAMVAIACAALSDDNVPPAIDLQGFDSAEIVLNIGVGGITFTSTNKIEFKLTHSDNGTDYEAVTVDDVLGVDAVDTGGIIKALKTAHAAAAVYRFGYIGSRRYLKLLADFGGTHASATPIAASVIKGHPHLAPVADAA